MICQYIENLRAVFKVEAIFVDPSCQLIVQFFENDSVFFGVYVSLQHLKKFHYIFFGQRAEVLVTQEYLL